MAHKSDIRRKRELTMKMEADERDVMIASYLLSVQCFALIVAAFKQKQKRRFWVRKIFCNRERHGQGSTLLRELRSQDQEFYYDFMRMTPVVFDRILNAVSPIIDKKNTTFRLSIPANERLAITLRFLATGETFRSLSFSFRIGRSTIARIVPETCKAIWTCFSQEFMQFPTTQQEWRIIAQEFEERWQLPHCCGSIDGKHVVMECPDNTASLNYNYKGTFSEVLMAVADARCRFIMIDYGHYGSESDGGIFKKCAFGKQLLRGSLNLPATAILPNSCTPFPHFFIGDEAFPLRHDMLRPYPRKSAFTNPEKIFNYRLSRARRVVENAFGILAARFRIFRRPLNFSTETTESVVLASCLLHNMLMAETNEYCPPGFCDYEDSDHVMHPGQWRAQAGNVNDDLGRLSTNMYSKHVKKARDTYKDYLCKEGAVGWQTAIVNRGLV